MKTAMPKRPVGDPANISSETQLSGVSQVKAQRTRKWAAAAVLIAVAVAVFTGALPHTTPAVEAQAAAVVVVKNTGKTSTTSAALGSNNAAFAQRFTATSFAGAYDLTSIGVDFDNIADTDSAGAELTVTLNEESSTLPGAALCTLNDPATFTSSGVQTFTAPATCPTLEPGNTYFVVVTRANNNSHAIALEATSNMGRDSGGASRWSIGNRAHRYINSSSTWAPGFVQANLQIEVKGTDASATTVAANWSLIPTDPPRGGKFRLMFITNTGHSPTSTDIADYNTYVQSQANDSAAHADIQDYSSTFRVLGSTDDVDARDNTRTKPNTDTSVPIYWMGGDKIADNYADLYDGSWDQEAEPTNSAGLTSFPTNGWVWTGSKNDGTASSLALGSASTVRAGRLFILVGDPLGNAEAHSPTTKDFPYYALSGIFVVPNTTASGVPTISGTPREDHVLTAAVSGISDPNGIDPDAYEYVWETYDGDEYVDISGAEGASYRTRTADVGKRIRVHVYFNDIGGNHEGPLTSVNTDPIVAANVLVGNTGQTVNTSLGTSLSTTVPRIAQGFSTGSDTQGYTLESIGVWFKNIGIPASAGAALTATLNAGGNDGNPAGPLCTLNDPSSFSGSGVNTFAGTSTCPTLKANLTYFLVVEHDGVTPGAVTLAGTNATAEDNGADTEWSINDGRHYHNATQWIPAASQPFLIEVKGTSAGAFRTWVHNQHGDVTTDYENTGDFKIAQGFRTGDTAGIYEINEISVDFDRGQPERKAIQVRIVESASLDEVDDNATPTAYWKGGNFPKRAIGTDEGTYTFTLDVNQVSGTNILDANTNYFITIESSSDDPDTAAIVRMNSGTGQTSNDGWTVDNHSYVKSRNDDSGWTKEDHQVRIRIAGEYQEGISFTTNSRAYESCHGAQANMSEQLARLTVVYEPCTLAVKLGDLDAPSDGVQVTSNLDTSALLGYNVDTWVYTREIMEFKIAIWPLLTGAQWVEVSYTTEDEPGVYAQGLPATAGVDFQKTTGKVKFEAGDRTKTVKVYIIDDSIEDSNEYLKLSIVGNERRGNSAPNYDISRRSVYGTIYNSEENPDLESINVSDVTVSEGEAATASFKVWLSGEVTAPVLAHYATHDGSAKAGEHYTATAGTLVIPHGETSVTVSVPILNDEVYTGERKFTLTITDPINAEIVDATGTATIKDDEAQPLIGHFTNMPSGNHGENSFTFNISFNQNVSTKYLVMQNDAMTVTNGKITRAERINGSRDFWRITVEPDSGADVTVHLPATVNCSDTGAICTYGTTPTPQSNSITHTFPGTQLNAQFQGLDAYHDGSTAFKFTVVFSEEVDTTAAEIRDHALSITGGTFTNAVQKDDDSARRWEVTVKPGGIDNIEVSLAAATDCDTDGHICTSDGELLSEGITEHSIGPRLMSVSDATVQEADEAELVFTVSLDKAWFGPDITVNYATSDGTATADDYTPTSGTLNFRWDQSLTVTVPVLTDSLTEEAETLTLTLSRPVNVVIADSEATGTIQDADPVAATPADSQPTGLPVITGAFRADEPLTADTAAINDANGLDEVSYGYQWIITTNGTDADLSGATSSTYTPNNDQVGNTFKVRVSFTDDDGYAHTLTSESTTPITQRTDPAVWTADMLVVEYSEISIGAASADLFSNIGGTRTLSIQSLWSYVPDHDLKLAFNEALDDADDLTLIIGDLQLEFPSGSSGNGSFKWTGVDLDWQDGQTLAVRIVPTSSLAETPAPNTAAAGQPTITGTPQVGQVLTADTSQVTDADGLLSVSYLYQWIAADVNIPNATRQSYTLDDDDQGKAIKVTVSFNDDRNNPETLTSVATDPVTARPNTAAAGVPSIQGVLQDQQRLTADTAGIIDADSLTNATFVYQWMRVDDGTPSDITGQTGSAYTLTSNDVGQSIQLQVTFTDDRGFSESLTSAVTDAVTASGSTRKILWLATIVPKDQDGQAANYTYDASTDDATLSPAAFTADEDSVQTITYLGASQDNATEFAVDLSSQLSNQQTSTWRLVLPGIELDFRSATYATSTTSPPAHRYQWDVTEYATDTASLPQDGDLLTVSIQEAINLAATGQPTISGTPQVGDSLNADTSAITDGNGLSNASYQYQWTAGGSNIDGATASSLLLTSSQEGDTIQVIVTFDDDDGFSETATSEATTAVAAGAVVNSPPNGLPTISGTPEVDQTLTADTSAVTDGDGLSNVSYNYQWLGDGSAISGATGSSLLLTSTQLAQTIQVRVTFDDDAGTTESLTSAATVAVTAKPVPLTASLTSVPATHNGSTKFTFELTFSENVKAGYERIRDEAFTVVGGDIKRAQRREQGTNQYWTITVEPDGNASVYVTLPATTDCSAASAICTYDDRKLSQANVATIQGPG